MCEEGRPLLPETLTVDPVSAHSEAAPQCLCAEHWPGKGHPPDCPVQREIEALRARVRELEEAFQQAQSRANTFAEAHELTRREKEAAESRLAQVESKLQRVRDWLKFAANSEGGIVAEIDAALSAPPAPSPAPEPVECVCEFHGNHGHQWCGSSLCECSQRPDPTPAPPWVRPHAFVTAACFPAHGAGACQAYVQGGAGTAICSRPSLHPIHDGFPPPGVPGLDVSPRVEGVMAGEAAPSRSQEAEPVAPCHLAPVYANALVKARVSARPYGYAIALHGSGTRDLDLIAVPWADGAAPAERIAAAVASAVTGFIEPTRNPVSKPHGRLCWTIHLGGGPFIDLSVMPTRDAAEPPTPSGSAK